MATDIIARAIGKSAKDKTDKITVNNNINLDIVSSTLAEMTNYSTVEAVDNTYTIDFANSPVKNVKIKTEDANAKTVVFTNVPTGDAELFIELTCTSAATITWFEDIDWLSGSDPTFTEGKVYRIALFKYGTGWHGNSVGGWLVI